MRELKFRFRGLFFGLVWFRDSIKDLRTVEEFIVSGSQMHSSLPWLILCN